MMPSPTNRLSYQDIYDVYDQALTDPKGIRLAFPNREAARNYQMRMHKARSLDREENAIAYPKGDPMHGQSPYDVLQVRIREQNDGEGDEVFLYIEPRDKLRPVIESLSEIEAEDEA
jgi:hypothetical protein